jgi:UDP-N-acetylmuramyl tripeptide synthase
MTGSAKTARLSLAASARRALAVSIGKVARTGVTRLGRRSATAIPGRVTLALDPTALAGLVSEIPRGTLLVTGSNGKGTTCRMLAAIMRSAGLHPVINQDGSNQRGLAATMVAHSAVTGHLRTGPEAIGLFEVDESSLPEILPQVDTPTAIVVTNVFRNHLDRYCEPVYLAEDLERAIRTLPDSTTLVLNADDPRAAYLAPELPNPRLYFGIEDTELGREGGDPASDFPRCPRCGEELAYRCVFYAHLGHWTCTACGLTRPQAQVSAKKVDLMGLSTTRLLVVTPTADTALDLPLPGLYNAYNALAAMAVAAQCELADRSLAAIENVTVSSFRMERVQAAGRDVYLALAKNANGYTEVLRAVLSDRKPKRMMLGLSDSAGKQRDTSWIWDVDFDALTGLASAPVVTGDRAADLAVRLKYARWIDSSRDPDLLIEADPVRAFQAALASTPPGQALWVISTSIVLWEVRHWLRQQGYGRALWQNQDQAIPVPRQARRRRSGVNI